ncbi:MAG: Diaminopimelate decarboxylase [Acidimicrobiaceae bacterium]|nr:MAG: Diaminopimelate decarboxylase [Acidimicrobiaceae bacterium]|tara:strand:+ start:3790 stop:5061 length:1272 start_codon:yes stop_codon:yes gene_type:complete
MAGPIQSNLLPDTADISSEEHTLIGGCNLVELADEFGTPLFVYDEDHLRSRCREAVQAFDGNVAYATKAFLCIEMAKLAYQEGMNLDVATGGELYIARKAGVPGERIVMHGNNKSLEELNMALKEGVGRIVVDSFDELDRLEELCANLNTSSKVLLRVTPGVEAHTHEFVSTGQEDSKFGFTVSSGVAEEAVQRARNSKHIELLGLHAHIGSQVFDVRPFAKAVGVLAEFAAPYDFPELVVGGGLGVPYVEGESAPSIQEWADAIFDACAEAGVKSSVGAEPGRSIVASAAVTLYTVGTIKEVPDHRTYVSVDGGMSDNPRPALYGSGYETFLPRSNQAERRNSVRLVGKHCESGDFLIKEAWVPEDLSVGDILATPVTGAYGHSMGSNYNQMLRPAVVFVSGGSSRLVVARESYEDLTRRDI